MFLPEAIDGVEDDVALQAFYRGGLFVSRFALVSVLNLFNQELRVFIDGARFKLSFLKPESLHDSRHPIGCAEVAHQVVFETYIEPRCARVALARAASA